ncbi:hypothetical protein ACIA6C_32700 [Streptomyces sp. NPDC051578]|uniref:hypothetical protein n=1 Tax=Streptomyces sp. NPDC051578 TaxID=3365662 RepID=UPI00379D4416
MERLLTEPAPHADVWDRPDGDWGPGLPADEAGREQRRHANSCYRMGSLALARGDLVRAEGWLNTAMKADHPGAWFRAGALVCYRGPQLFGGDGAAAYLRYLIDGAAERGHGDAHRLRPLLTNRLARLPAFQVWEDPDYGLEVMSALQCGLDNNPRRDGPPMTKRQTSRFHANDGHSQLTPLYHGSNRDDCARTR